MLEMEKGTYWLTRIVFFRALSFIYSVAFLVAIHQNKQLIGRRGLLPAHTFLRDLQQRVGSNDVPSLLGAAPTVLWFVDWQHFDFYLDLIAYVGLAISALVFITGAANAIAWLVLWVLYHSIVNVGQRWYSFGWESQLLETGFLAIFSSPLFAWKQFPKYSPPPWVVIYGYRWLVFRIMLGAGLIKIRGDKCWRDLTCLNYHYETQPVPNPNAYFLHQLPELVHKFETLGNHFVELLAPFMVWLTRPFVIYGGIIQIVFQVLLIISGNLSFLNWLTILPSIWCLDDYFLSTFFPSSTLDKLLKIQREPADLRLGFYIRQVLNVTLLALLAYLSIPVVQNLLSSRQMMNTSFDPLRIVNTYGAFGSITKERTEVIVQGTLADDPTDPSAEWREYEFRAKPGNVMKRPPYFSPYHYRLDWLMWFAAFQNYQHNPWLVHLVAKLLRNDEQVSTLLALNPFLGSDPPKFIRLEHYRYAFTKIGSAEALRGQWWKRRKIGSYMPPVNLEMLEPILRKFHWTEE